MRYSNYPLSKNFDLRNWENPNSRLRFFKNFTLTTNTAMKHDFSRFSFANKKSPNFTLASRPYSTPQHTNYLNTLIPSPTHQHRHNNTINKVHCSEKIKFQIETILFHKTVRKSPFPRTVGLSSKPPKLRSTASLQLTFCSPYFCTSEQLI